MKPIEIQPRHIYRITKLYGGRIAFFKNITDPFEGDAIPMGFLECGDMFFAISNITQQSPSVKTRKYVFIEAIGLVKEFCGFIFFFSGNNEDEVEEMLETE